MDRSSFSQWRNRRGLAPIGSLWISSEEEARRLEVFERGLSDVASAAALGIPEGTFSDWRCRRNLHPSASIRQREADAVRQLRYDMGWSDVAIARELNVQPPAICKWRKRVGLPVNRLPTKRSTSVRPLLAADVLARARRAVGRRLPPDQAEEAVSALLLAIAEGEMTIEAIEAQARKFGSRAMNEYANKHGNRSLDANVGEHEGFTLLDTIADDSQSGWLEESGATVW